ncbi:MAG: PAS domain S-box protein [Candidatus Latescibacteria bacterium]|nr:PAS domain S-box protein [Candidatus Latescibacterota bacterium]
MPDDATTRDLVAFLRQHEHDIFSRWVEETERRGGIDILALPVSRDAATRWLSVLFRLIVRHLERPDSLAIRVFIRRFVHREDQRQFPIHAVLRSLIILKRIIIGLLVQSCRENPERLRVMCDTVEAEMDDTRLLVFDLYIAQQERQIGQRERYLQSIISSSADAIIILDGQLVVRSWNRGAEAIYGYRAEEMIGQSFIKLVPEELLQQGEFERIIKRIREEGFVQGYETVRLAKGGRRVNVEFTATALVDEQGNPTGFISSIIRDVTRRVELEQRLERKVAGLSIVNEIGRALQHTIDLDEILYTVLVGVTAGQGLKFNRAFLLLLNPERTWLEGRLAIGTSSPEEAGRIWAELAAKQHSLDDILRSYRAATSAQDVRVNEIVRQLRIPLADASHLLVQALQTRQPINVVDARHHPGVPPDFFDVIGSTAFAIVPLISQEQAVGVLLADNLITRRPILDEDLELLEVFAHQASAAIEKSRLYEALEQQVSALEQANDSLKTYQEKLIHAERLSAIGELAATVAHEIRNPLVSIGGFARSLLRKVPADSPHREYLEIIVKEGVRLEEIVTKVLDLARPKHLRATPHDLNQLIQEGLMVVREDIQTKQIRVDQTLQPELPPVPVDADQMKQVFLNLFKNAVYAMPSGGRLRVWTAATNHAFLEIGIADTGTGIAEEHLEKVFNPFFTTKPGGAGLGLAVASRIVHDHGGTIRVESTVGRGTTFYIHLPLRQHGD